jgi:hypothetical protein
MSFRKCSLPERFTGAIRVKYLAQGHINIFFTSGIQTSNILVSVPNS